ILERLATAASTETYPPASAIIAQGDAADALYVLAQGEVQITARSENGGPDRTVATMSAPAFFGEIGLLAAIPRTATVTALNRCQCLRIDGDAFLAALTTSPPSTGLMETARSRLAVTLPS